MKKKRVIKLKLRLRNVKLDPRLSLLNMNVILVQTRLKELVKELGLKTKLQIKIIIVLYSVTEYDLILKSPELFDLIKFFLSRPEKKERDLEINRINKHRKTITKTAIFNIIVLKISEYSRIKESEHPAEHPAEDNFRDNSKNNSKNSSGAARVRAGFVDDFKNIYENGKDPYRDMYTDASVELFLCQKRVVYKNIFEPKSWSNISLVTPFDKEIYRSLLSREKREKNKATDEKFSVELKDLIEFSKHGDFVKKDFLFRVSFYDLYKRIYLFLKKKKKKKKILF